MGLHGDGWVGRMQRCTLWRTTDASIGLVQTLTTAFDAPSGSVQCASPPLLSQACARRWEFPTAKSAVWRWWQAQQLAWRRRQPVAVAGEAVCQYKGVVEGQSPCIPQPQRNMSGSSEDEHACRNMGVGAGVLGICERGLLSVPAPHVAVGRRSHGRANGCALNGPRRAPHAGLFGLPASTMMGACGRWWRAGRQSAGEGAWQPM